MISRRVVSSILPVGLVKMIIPRKKVPLNIIGNPLPTFPLMGIIRETPDDHQTYRAVVMIPTRAILNEYVGTLTDQILKDAVYNQEILAAVIPGDGFLHTMMLTNATMVAVGADHIARWKTWIPASSTFKAITF